MCTSGVFVSLLLVRRAFQVENMLLVVMQSAHLVAQRKAFQQSMEDVLTLSREQTSSQPLIASALEDLKVPMLLQNADAYPCPTFKSATAAAGNLNFHSTLMVLGKMV